MRLRHVLLLASGAGAAGALLLAADIHRRVQEAQREMVLNSTVPGHDSVIHFGDAHMLGLIALAFLFIAFFLLIFSEPLRKSAETKPAAASAIAPPPIPSPVAVAPVTVAAPPRIEVSTVPAPVPVPAPQPEVVASEVHPAETVPAAATPMTDAPPPMSMPNTPSAAPQPSLSNDASAASGVSDSESSKAHER